MSHFIHYLENNHQSEFPPSSFYIYRERQYQGSFPDRLDLV